MIDRIDQEIVTMFKSHSPTYWIVLVVFSAPFLANRALAAPPDGDRLIRALFHTKVQIAESEMQLDALNQDIAAYEDAMVENMRLYRESGKEEFLVAYEDAKIKHEEAVSAYESAKQWNEELTARFNELKRQIAIEIDETTMAVAELESKARSLKEEASKLARQAHDYKKLFDETGEARYLNAYEATLVQYEKTLEQYDAVSGRLTALSIYLDRIKSDFARIVG
jgi:chromosome segregation ATPase